MYPFLSSLEHTFKANSPGPESDRTMIFYHDARVDGLTRREETPSEMVEHFVDRDDFHNVFFSFLYRAHIQGQFAGSGERPYNDILPRRTGGRADTAGGNTLGDGGAFCR